MYRNNCYGKNKTYHIFLHMLILLFIDCTNKQGAEEKIEMIKNYRGQVEKELRDICSDILNVLEKHLIPCAGTGESKVFYYKMKGDYHRYLAEFATGTDRKDAAENSLVAYKAASDIAMTDLPPTHPIRLGLALNFSVSSRKQNENIQI